ncbi:MAG TPA: CHC2 zinc finger domain-containing protein, partial [Thermomicrobiales bacterium]|nr:CHC2 zinc finger domain-containing protein [Thermomicrobiales bacterium]
MGPTSARPGAPPPRYDLAALRRDHPLAEVMARSGLRLRRQGHGTYVARCPFHADRRPSLLVDARDQHFHCFGCGAHGDVVDFVMRRHGLTFREACARLAGLPPLPIAAVTTEESGRGRDWERLAPDEQAVLDLACACYQWRLWREPRALAYLRARGLTDRTILACRL